MNTDNKDRWYNLPAAEVLTRLGSNRSGLSQADADLLQSIANQVAIAVQNARVYSRAQRQSDREALIASIGQRIQSAMSVDDVLQVAVDELGQALRAGGARVEIGGLRSLAAGSPTEEFEQYVK